MEGVCLTVLKDNRLWQLELSLFWVLRTGSGELAQRNHFLSLTYQGPLVIYGNA